MKQIYLWVIVLLIIPLGSTQLIYEERTEVDLKIPCEYNGSICSSSAACNITIYYPNSSYLIDYEGMTNLENGDFNITLNVNETTPTGEYHYKMPCCDKGDCNIGYGIYEITVNGREKPTGIVIVVFSFLFMIIIGGLAYLILYSLGHFIQLDFDLSDLMKNVCAYFVLLAAFFLSKHYLGNAMVDKFLVWIIAITGFTNVAMAFLAFIISFMFGEVMKPKEKY